jgi:hypothetical protein
MKKFAILVFILLIGGFVQSSMAQLQAPVPQPEELVFLPNNADTTILVYQRIGKDLIFKQEVKILKEMESKIDHPDQKNLIDFLCEELNSGQDTFCTSYREIRGRWHFTQIFLNNSDDKYEKEEGFYFDREQMQFNNYSKKSNNGGKLFLLWAGFGIFSVIVFLLSIIIISKISLKYSIYSIFIGYGLSCLFFMVM